MSTGNLVEFKDGRKGIIFHNDQKKSFKGKDEGKVLVTMVDENYRAKDEPKRIVDSRNLKIVGFVD